jgi:glutathione S-transferase
MGDAFNPSPEVLNANPLALFPALEVSEGVWVPDSASILEFLDDTHGGLWPQDPEARVRTRIASTWAEGIMTATVGHYLESQRSAPDPEWSAEHLANIRRTLERVQKLGLSGLPWLESGQPTQAGWDLAVALEYLTVRIPQLDWEKEFPVVTEVLEVCRKNPDFQATTPPK